MDWMYINPNDSGGSSENFQLGIYVGDQFRISANASETLIDICTKLHEEDKEVRNFRRKLGVARVAEKNLAPILVEASSAPDTFDVFSATIK